jgi:transposase
MNEGTTRFLGLDVHKATIVAAVADESSPPILYGTIANDPGAVRKMIQRLRGEGVRLRAAYEAGPTGYALHRQLQSLGVECMVVVPCLIPRTRRVKTDKRDALALARLLRTGDLTPVWIPDQEEEALRDLLRLRFDAKEDLLRVRHRLSKFLLRQGLYPPPGVKAWSKAYQQWLNQLKFGRAASQVVLEEYRTSERASRDRLRHIEAELHRCAEQSPRLDLIIALQSLRGIAFLSAVTIVAETGDFRRFASARRYMSHTGLTASEHSSGQSHQQGGITRAGNPYLRHVLVQAAHNARYAPTLEGAVGGRLQDAPRELVELSLRSQQRLHARYRHLERRIGRRKAVTAVARELAGFVWAIGQRQERIRLEAATA